MWTLLPLLNKADEFLKENRIPSSRLEAEILLAHTLGYDRVQLYTHFARPMDQEEVDRFRSFVMRRIRGEPSAYLTGWKEFFSLSFQVSPGVFIPRPETEEVVQLALEGIPGDGSGMEAADMGTGSGCIAVTLCKLKGGLRARAFDHSPRALEVAEKNAEHHGVADRITFVHGDFLSLLEDSSSISPFHLVLCNPPYVDPSGSQPVDPQVAEYEPRDAVFSPPGDPLFFYRKILEGGQTLLAAEGALIFELGAGLSAGVESLAARWHWHSFARRKDLAGIDRVVGFRSAT